MNDTYQYELLTVDEACEALRVGKTRMYQMLKNNMIGNVHEGRIYMIPRYCIESYIEEHTGKIPERTVWMK